MKILRFGIVLSLLSAACDSSPHLTEDAAADSATDAPTDGNMPDGNMPDSNDDGGMTCMPRNAADVPAHDASCTVAATDFQQCTDDLYPSCISDSGEYVRIRDSISSIARVMAYENIRSMISMPGSVATEDAFTAARALYQEDEGLDSRVARRYDERYAPVASRPDCTMAGMASANPDYCVGPATLQPMILQAFRCGAGAGLATDTCPSERGLNAAHIEAALQWFLYISAIKESMSCTTSIGDCDSSYAYYTGGELNRGGIGLAGEFRRVHPYAHDRVWDGILAVRCWRDLDSADTATMLDVRNRARLQFTTALDAGYAYVVASAIEDALAATGTTRDYHWEKLKILARGLDFPLRAKSAAAADALKSFVEAAAFDETTGAALVSQLHALFVCG